MLISLICSLLLFSFPLMAGPAKIICVPSAEQSNGRLTLDGITRAYGIAHYFIDEFCKEFNKIRIVSSRGSGHAATQQTIAPLALLLKKPLSLPYPNGEEANLVTHLLSDLFYDQALVIIYWPADSMDDLLTAFATSQTFQGATFCNRFYVIDPPFTEVKMQSQNLLFSDAQ